METFKTLIHEMEGKNLIINKDKVNHESFYIVEEPLNTNFEDSEENQDDEDTIEKLTSFVDEKLYEVIINNVNNEVRNIVDSELRELKNTSNANKLNAINVPGHKDMLLKSLNDQISLRKQLEFKDDIIKLLLDERSQLPKQTANEETKNSDLPEKNNKKNTTTESNVKLLNSGDKSTTNKQICATDGDFTVVQSRKSKADNRQIVVLGDSLVKHILPYKMKLGMKNKQEKIYVKAFPGASTADMLDYSKPSKRHKSDLFILHIGSNDLRSTKSPEEIATGIINLALDLKTDENDVVISRIICRNDELNEKAIKVNDLIESKATTYASAFLNNNNITINKHLNGSGFHLNYYGTAALANNFLKIINV